MATLDSRLRLLAKVAGICKIALGRIFKDALGGDSMAGRDFSRMVQTRFSHPDCGSYTRIFFADVADEPETQRQKEATCR